MSVGNSSSTTTTDSQSSGTSETTTEQEGHSYARSMAHKTVRFSIDEEARVRSYELANLARQQAFVLERGSGKPATLIRTHDVPREFETTLGGNDCVEEVLKRVRPPAVEVPETTVFERLAVSMRRQLAGRTGPGGL